MTQTEKNGFLTERSLQIVDELNSKEKAFDVKTNHDFQKCISIGIINAVAATQQAEDELKEKLKNKQAAESGYGSEYEKYKKFVTRKYGPDAVMSYKDWLEDKKTWNKLFKKNKG